MCEDIYHTVALRNHRALVARRKQLALLEFTGVMAAVDAQLLHARDQITASQMWVLALIGAAVTFGWVSNHGHVWILSDAQKYPEWCSTDPTLWCTLYLIRGRLILLSMVVAGACVWPYEDLPRRSNVPVVFMLVTLMACQVHVAWGRRVALQACNGLLTVRLTVALKRSQGAAFWTKLRSTLALQCAMRIVIVCCCGIHDVVKAEVFLTTSVLELGLLYCLRETVRHRMSTAIFPCIRVGLADLSFKGADTCTYLDAPVCACRYALSGGSCLSHGGSHAQVSPGKVVT